MRPWVPIPASGLLLASYRHEEQSSYVRASVLPPCPSAHSSMNGFQATSPPSAPTHHPYLRVRGSSLNHRNSETGDAFTPTDGTESLGAISLHRHRSTDGVG